MNIFYIIKKVHNSPQGKVFILAYVQSLKGSFCVIVSCDRKG